MIENLKNIFQRKNTLSNLYLKRQLLSLKCKKKDSVEEHFSKFDKLIEDIEINGTKMEEQDIVCQLLLSVEEAYQPVVTALEMSNTKLTVEFIKGKLLDAELKEKNQQKNIQKKSNPHSGYVFQSASLKCYNCGEPNHFARNCPNKAQCSNQRGRGNPKTRGYQKRGYRGTNNRKLSANVGEGHVQKEDITFFAAQAYTVNNTDHENKSIEFVIDSGASYHMAFSDSDWDSEHMDRKSISGVAIFYQGNLVSWSSKKQTTVALSTAESECVAAALTDKNYKNRGIVAEAWLEIAREMGNENGKQWATKWKSLRDNYKKFKKSIETASGSAYKKYKNWPWADQQRFLDDTIALNETDNNINSENRNSTSQVSHSTNQPSPSNSVDLRDSVSDSENLSRPGSSNSIYSRNSAKNKNITQKGDSDLQQQLLKYLHEKRQNKRSLDDIDYLFQSYATFMKKMPARMQKYIKRESPVVPRLTQATYEYGVTSDMLRVAQAVTIAPEPIKKIINAIGHLKYEDKIFLPAVAAEPRDANSSIPGAIWADHILMNPNEIIPEHYDIVDDFRRDFLLIAPFLASLQKYVPKMVGGPIDIKSSGRPSLLISNRMGNLRVPQRNAGEDLDAYYRRSVPLSNVRNYTSLARLTPSERIEGQVNLLGEYPSDFNLRYLMYHLRDEVACAYDVTSDYADVAFFRPLKVAWRQILQKWKKTDGRLLSCVPKGCFPKMLKLLMDQININSENNIRAGFHKTGITPFNPNEVLARLPEETQNDEEVKKAIDKSSIPPTDVHLQDVPMPTISAPKPVVDSEANIETDKNDDGFIIEKDNKEDHF
ncbi:unnamed protein product [Arctia plantaginis]|uniref:CCHC-type domain-containing protein n=1 Tax=Arctia plantaginis TaxID=874455 RepID=A0A8S0ZKF1_ARCPL|nr:unnamed protein product [Arctia plantaginis]